MQTFDQDPNNPLAFGDRVEFQGFQSPDHMELNWLTNHTTGRTIQLRTAEFKRLIQR